GLGCSGPGLLHRLGDVEEVARLDGLARCTGSERGDRRLVPDGRDGAAVRRGRAGSEAVRPGWARLLGNRPRHLDLDDPVGANMAQNALAAPRIADRHARCLRLFAQAEVNALVLGGEVAAAGADLLREARLA